MDDSRPTETDQATLWNGVAGRTWVEAQDLLDRLFKPIEELLVNEATALTPTKVLDAGCGTGATTVAVARMLGTSGHCTGLDISEPMIDAARKRAESERTPLTFICADGQDYAFEPDSFDLIISRFGVMFFEDPPRAFANFRRAARLNANLRLVAWRGASQNPFMTTAQRAAAPLLPDLPLPKPNGPGQFAFGDPGHITTILEAGGWAEIDIRPLDIVCTMSESDLIPYISRLGPVGRILQESDEQTRQQVVTAIRPAFDQYVHDGQVRFTAACWMIAAKAAVANEATTC